MSDPVTIICPRCEGTGVALLRPTGRPPIFTDAQKEEIRSRRAAGERGVDLAEEYGVTPSTISRVWHDVGARA